MIAQEAVFAKLILKGGEKEANSLPLTALAVRCKPNMEEKIGDVTHYFGHIPAGIIKLTAPLKVGDQIHFKGVTTDFEQEIISMQLNHKDIKKAKPGNEIGVEVTDRVREGDEVFLVT